MLADCGNVSNERFVLAHRRSLTDIKRKTYQDIEMHTWGAPRRVIVSSSSAVGIDLEDVSRGAL
eukprot:3187355-Pyramimonas_sp.AAC.1